MGSRRTQGASGAWRWNGSEEGPAKTRAARPMVIRTLTHWMVSWEEVRPHAPHDGLVHSAVREGDGGQDASEPGGDVPGGVAGKAQQDWQEDEAHEERVEKDRDAEHDAHLLGRQGP